MRHCPDQSSEFQIWVSPHLHSWLELSYQHPSQDRPWPLQVSPIWSSAPQGLLKQLSTMSLQQLSAPARSVLTPSWWHPHLKALSCCSSTRLSYAVNSYSADPLTQFQQAPVWAHGLWSTALMPVSTCRPPTAVSWSAAPSQRAVPTAPLHPSTFPPFQTTPGPQKRLFLGSSVLNQERHSCWCLPYQFLPPWDGSPAPRLRTQGRRSWSLAGPVPSLLVWAPSRKFLWGRLLDRIFLSNQRWLLSLFQDVRF